MAFVLPVGIALALALALAMGPSARGAEGGQISGKVIDATSKAPVEGIEVCAYEEDGEESPGNCATSGPGGEYTISGLPAGEYFIEFAAPIESTLNYIAQYYEDSSTAEGAKAVHVLGGQTTSGIDAELQEGGRIAGRVTDASTGAPIGQALVCAFGAGFESGGCGPTNASGEYTIGGLPGGEYRVGFIAGANYSVQYYQDKPTLAEAQGVSVTVGATTSGIDAAMQPGHKSLIGEQLPTLPGSKAPGGLGSTESGSSSSIPLLVLTTSKILISRRSAFVHLDCRQAPCMGSGELILKIAGRGRTVLARGSFSLKEGQSGEVSLRLTAIGRKRLAHAKRHPLGAEVTLSIKGAKTLTRQVLVS